MKQEDKEKLEEWKAKQPNPNIKYICLTAFWIILIIVLGTMFITGMNNKGEMEADCDLGEIKYGIDKINNGTKCWDRNILPENCPMPTELKCKVRVKMNAYNLGQFLLSFD